VEHSPMRQAFLIPERAFLFRTKTSLPEIRYCLINQRMSRADVELDFFLIMVKL
jgi:hypothetical protein